MAMAEVATLTLSNICLDVQIDICMFLHPSDILTLRKTCKALQPSTWQRVVWVAALHRVCLDNALFLPSYPIPDMSDLELEKAAMAPRRWIELCVAFEKQYLNDPGAQLCPRATRFINDLLTIEVDESTEFFIVPGGRYLLSYSPEGISVLDLGYTSNADCKLIASVGPEGGSDICLVQATPDGMGLVIFSSKLEYCSIYEIYPQSETPHLTQIAYLAVDNDLSGDSPAHLLPDTAIWRDLYKDRIVFRVWDYRQNHSKSFSVDVDVEKFEFNLETIVTKTAVIVLCEEAILIWAIPPLSPQLPDFLDDNPTHMPPPLFTIPLPDGTALHFDHIKWKMISTWYLGSSRHLYFDMLCQGSKRHRFQIMLKPDLSTASLHVINTSEPIVHDLNYVFFEDYRICEDTLVSCWYYYHGSHQYQCGVYTGLTSARFANVISNGGPAAKMLLSNDDDECHFFSCPTSCRFVRLDESNIVTVLDFF